MHADNLHITYDLVRGLIADQFPQWSSLSLTRFPSAGTDNAIYRLGSDLCLRLPRRMASAHLVKKEVRWLPRLQNLPLRVPRPQGRGQSGSGYPANWGFFDWIEGVPATMEGINQPCNAATALGQFITALQKVNIADAPLSGDANHHRGVPLIQRDALTRRAIHGLRHVFDHTALIVAWEATLSAPPWTGPPVWLHGDLQAGNLLAQDGVLTAVIDFGLMGAGDPACDLLTAWWYLPAKARPAFRAAVGVDQATWNRGRGWALSTAVIALDYYIDTNPTLAATTRRALDQILADPAGP